MPVSRDGLSRHQIKTYFLMFTAFFLGFSFPISIALINVSLIFALIALAISHDFTRAIVLAKQPLFYLPLIMFLLLAASLFYADNEFGRTMLSKYKKLLYVFPLALFFLQDKRLAKITLIGFVVANTIVLILSLLALLNWFNVFNIEPNNPTVFHLHITQNFFMAITCLIWLIQIFKTSGWQRAGYGILLLLGLFDVLFVVIGRIGYLAIAVGLGVWLWQVLNSKQRILLVVGGCIGLLLVSVVPNKIKDRVMLGVDEIQQCVNSFDPNASTPDVCRTSMGLRTEFAYRAILLIKSSPIIGVGVGGFDYYSDSGEFHHVNPHNEYLMQTLQSGIIGLGLFLLWVFLMYRAAFLLPSLERSFLVAIITIYMVGCLFNSFILDSHEGQAWMVFVAYLAAEMARRKNIETIGK